MINACINKPTLEEHPFCVHAKVIKGVLGASELTCVVLLILSVAQVGPFTSSWVMPVGGTLAGVVILDLVTGAIARSKRPYVSQVFTMHYVNLENTPAREILSYNDKLHLQKNIVMNPGDHFYFLEEGASEYTLNHLRLYIQDDDGFYVLNCFNDPEEAADALGLNRTQYRVPSDPQMLKPLVDQPPRVEAKRSENSQPTPPANPANSDYANFHYVIGGREIYPYTQRKAQELNENLQRGEIFLYFRDGVPHTLPNLLLCCNQHPGRKTLDARSYSVASGRAMEDNASRAIISQYARGTLKYKLADGEVLLSPKGKKSRSRINHD